MTHYISMRVVVKTWDDVENIRDQILDPSNGTSLYTLVKDNNWKEPIEFHTAKGTAPFIYFPDNAKDKGEDGCYHITVDTGSHCAWSDTDEIFYVWSFWVIFWKHCYDCCFDKKPVYSISEDGEDNHYTLKQALKLILDDSEELREIIRG